MIRCMISAAVFALILLDVASAQGCDFPPKGFLEEPRVKFEGLYRNPSYGYSVVIPRAVAGFDNPNAAKHDGFGIAIGQKAESYILVQAEPNSSDDSAPTDSAFRILKYMREQKKRILTLRMGRARLDSLDAVEIVVTYACPGSPDQYRMAAVLALGPDQSPVYELALYTSASRYSEDRLIFDEVVKSWKYTGY
jgi:hypothetical protein